MHDFYPSGGRGGGTIEDSDGEDEFENFEIDLIQELLSEDAEIQPQRLQFLGNLENMESSDSDSDYNIEDDIEEGSDIVLDSSSESNEEHEDQNGTENNKDNKDPGEGTSNSSSATTKPVEKRVIDDYDENEEDDEVIKKLILELKKPRSKPPDIETDDNIVDLSFHPSRNLLAVGSIVGDILIYQYTNEENKLLHTHEVHTKAIRDIEFSVDGTTLLSASRDKSITITDLETGNPKMFWEKAHEEPVYTLSVIDENLFASGDDNGVIKMWDLRLKWSNPVMSLKIVEDFVSSIVTNSQKKLLCCTSSDGFLTTINITAKKQYVQSEPYEEELSCSGVFRNESKLVVGSSKGNFYTYNWGQFGYHCDAFSGPSTPITQMVPITERIAVTAGDEGIIRAMHLVPGRILGVVGQHSLGVDAMDISYDGELIASCSHFNDIRFWNIKFFEDFDDIKYNEKPNKNAKNHNLPSSKFQNRGDFFADLA